MRTFKYKFKVWGQVQISGDGTCVAEDVESAIKKAQIGISEQLKVKPEEVNITSIK